MIAFGFRLNEFYYNFFHINNFNINIDSKHMTASGLRSNINFKYRS